MLTHFRIRVTDATAAISPRAVKSRVFPGIVRLPVVRLPDVVVSVGNNSAEHFRTPKIRVVRVYRHRPGNRHILHGAVVAGNGHVTDDEGGRRAVPHEGDLVRVDHEIPTVRPRLHPHGAVVMERQQVIRRRVRRRNGRLTGLWPLSLRVSGPLRRLALPLSGPLRRLALALPLLTLRPLSLSGDLPLLTLLAGRLRYDRSGRLVAARGGSRRRSGLLGLRRAGLRQTGAAVRRLPADVGALALTLSLVESLPLTLRIWRQLATLWRGEGLRL